MCALMYVAALTANVDLEQILLVLQKKKKKMTERKSGDFYGEKEE